MHSRPFMVFVMILFLFTPDYGVGQSFTSAQIDSLVDATRQKMPLAGIAIGVVKDGQVVHHKGYGMTAVDNPQPVNAHTRFAIASNSKAFTTAALAILVDEGKLTWEDKVVDHIPEFRMYAPYVTANFNIQDLLTHRSGLGLGAGDLMFFPDGADFSMEDVLKSFQYQQPVSAFRTKYDYDNLLYLVAGEVVARVSGQSWADFVRERIMEPLGMYESVPVYQQTIKKDNVAMPHRVAENQLVQLETYTKPNASLGAAGGIYASVHDLTKWMIMHLNGGVYMQDGMEQRLISVDSHREIFRPHTNIDFELLPDAPYYTHFFSYGLGWGIRDRKGMICAEHTGVLPGMLSRTILVPRLKLGIVVLTNTDPGGYAYRSISQSILDGYLNVIDRDWIDTYERQISEMASTSDAVTHKVWQTVEENKFRSLNLDAYTGVYHDDWFGRVVVGVKNGQLWFSSLRSPKLSGPMHYYKGNTFAIRWDYRDMNCDAFASFMLDTEGNAVRISMKGISPNIDFSFDFQDLDLRRVEE